MKFITVFAKTLTILLLFRGYISLEPCYYPANSVDYLDQSTFYEDLNMTPYLRMYDCLPGIAFMNSAGGAAQCDYYGMQNNGYDDWCREHFGGWAVTNGSGLDYQMSDTSVLYYVFLDQSNQYDNPSDEQECKWWDNNPNQAAKWCGSVSSRRNLNVEENENLENYEKRLKSNHLHSEIKINWYKKRIENANKKQDKNPRELKQFNNDVASLKVEEEHIVKSQKRILEVEEERRRLRFLASESS